jgi:hypothetical protein
VSGTVSGKSIIVTGAGRGIGARVCVANLYLDSANSFATEMRGFTGQPEEAIGELCQPTLPSRHLRFEDTTAVPTFLASAGWRHLTGQTIADPNGTDMNFPQECTL